ncbi:hypothetical protein IVB22_34620 [Bradyrhizobium sp. 190]|uniref:hypothetical protein n=1 Tax=Bradyrhizobium sp. 190 TaxID=2782658 RepID=UPI001FF7DB78|nr:hypothetical protein [Bradyrhizobium sp. 190]MCK1517538.1 hypothetical protein [Bradyrhizobium sp. 190]
MTPYGIATHGTFLPFFREAGFEITTHGTFEKRTDAEISAISREAIFDAAKVLIKNAKSRMRSFFRALHADRVSY